MQSIGTASQSEWQLSAADAEVVRRARGEAKAGKGGTIDVVIERLKKYEPKETHRA